LGESGYNLVINNLKHIFHNSIIHPRHLAQRELIKCVKAESRNMVGNLLDVGCGKKPYAPLLSNASRYIGLDVPTTMHSLTQVDIIGTALALPIRDECFDSLLCTEVLEHTPDPLGALLEMWRVANPGGILLLTIPLSEQLHEEPYDYYRFTKYGLDYLLNESGWKSLRIYERGGAWLEFGYRFSSFLYSTVGTIHNEDGTLKPRTVVGPLVVMFCVIVQLVADVLNSVWKSKISTIGYAVVAQKEN
jgi:SAM-dependent methyltransferase